MTSIPAILRCRGRICPLLTPAGLARVRDESRNGTFIELRGSLRLNEGDEVWIGEQRFRFVELRSEVLPQSGTASMEPSSSAVEQTHAGMPTPVPPAASKPAASSVAAAPPPTPVPAPAAAPTGDPMIVLPDGTEIAAGTDKANDPASWRMAATPPTTPAVWATTVKRCGSVGMTASRPTAAAAAGKCVVTVIEGMSNLSDASSREKNTIKKANKKLGGKLDEPNCRLACQAIVNGPVKIKPKGK